MTGGNRLRCSSGLSISFFNIFLITIKQHINKKTASYAKICYIIRIILLRYNIGYKVIRSKNLFSRPLPEEVAIQILKSNKYFGIENGGR